LHKVQYKRNHQTPQARDPIAGRRGLVVSNWRKDMEEEQYQQIIRRLDFHSERLNAHDKALSDFSEIKKEVSIISMFVKTNNSFLYGNGKSIGLDEEFRGLKKSIDGWTKIGKYFSGIVGAYLILEIVKFVLANIGT
jgi:hypothetical protein